MKKFVKRTLAMALAVIMIVSVLSIAAFADRNEKLTQYKYYTVLGDSIASAYGTEAYHSQLPADVPVCDGNIVEGSYAAILADAVGAEYIDMRSHSGWRTTELLREMNYPGFTYDNDAYSDYYNSNFFRRALNFIPDSNLYGEGDRINNAIKNADLITLNIGTNDIFSYALTVTVNKFSYIFENSGILDIKGIGDLNAAFNELLRVANDRQMKGIITEFVTAIETGFAMYRQNFPMVIDAIKSINPDAKLIVLGLSNPINMVINVNEKVGIDLYTITDLLIDRANYFTRYNSGCTDDYMFVDVTKTEMFGVGVLDTELLFALDENVKYSAVKMVHPNEKGQAYMADQIIKTMLAEGCAPTATASYSRILKKTTVKWDSVDGAVSYRIYRSTSPDSGFKYVGSSVNNTYYDMLSMRGVTYYYKVCAVMNCRGSVVSAMSAPVSIVAK